MQSFSSAHLKKILKLPKGFPLKKRREQKMPFRLAQLSVLWHFSAVLQTVLLHL